MSRNDLHVTTELYAAVARGDLNAIRPHLAHDLVVDVPGDLPWSDQYHGPDGFFALLGTLFGHVDTQILTDRVFDGGHAIVHVGRTVGTVRATGAAVDAPEVRLLRFRDGLFMHFEVFVDVTLMRDALAGQPARR